MDNDANITAIEQLLWNSYSMNISLEFIEKALQEVKLKPKTLSGCWKKICPIEDDPVHTADADKIVDTSEEINHILALSHGLVVEGFSDMAVDDLRELISVDVELTIEDLSDMVGECYEEEILDEELLGNVTVEGFTSETISEVIELGARLKSIVFEHDVNVERCLKFQRELDNVMTSYVEVYKEINNFSQDQFPVHENNNAEFIQIDIEELGEQNVFETKERSE